MKTIELFQWDLNQKISCQFPEAHFASIGSSDALIVSADGGNVSVPNILLQEPKDIMVWFMRDGAVADSGRIRVITRAKPADYIYTESEVITFETLVAKVEDVIAKADAATDKAATSAQKADAAANKANAASGKAAQVEAEIKANEVLRSEAEQGRVEAEAIRSTHESQRTETFNTNLTSWNSNVDAAVAKAQTATDNATIAANKAEAAVSKLPLPLGNTLKGEVEATLVNVDDAYPAPLVTTKVMGQSNQQQEPAPSPENPQEITNLNKAELVITGKNLADVNESNDVNFILRKKPLPAGTYTFSCDKGNDSRFMFNVKRLDSLGNVQEEIASSKFSPCTFTISEPTALFINGWGLNSPHSIGSIQLEAGSTATAYEPTLKPKATPIDLQGNELCSVTENRSFNANTFRDELVIDSEGNVSLIKRVFSAHIDGHEPMGLGATSTYQYFSYVPKTVRPIDGSAAICSSRFGEIGREPRQFYVAGGSAAALFFTFPLGTFANDGELNEWLKSNPIDVNYLGAVSQIIPLGKVELPALPEATSNIWNNGNIPANVYINYLKDVNIAYSDLENQIKQITAALSVMDTPTVIPEISEDEPTLIPELEESPIEESSK